jgi:hypothetical protein
MDELAVYSLRIAFYDAEDIFNPSVLGSGAANAKVYEL